MCDSSSTITMNVYSFKALRDFCGGVSFFFFPLLSSIGGGIGQLVKPTL